MQQSIQRVKLVTDALAAAGIELNDSKSQLHQRSVTFLSYIVSADGLSPPSDEISPIIDMPRPIMYKELCCFIGTINYHRKHLPAAAEILSPLTEHLPAPILLVCTPCRELMIWTEPFTS